jgi:hypothetical protein
MRVVPRSIHGTVVYQTPEEDRRMSVLEVGAVSVFAIGMILGVIYLEKWSTARAREAEDEMAEERG